MARPWDGELLRECFLMLPLIGEGRGPSSLARARAAGLGSGERELCLVVVLWAHRGFAVSEINSGRTWRGRRGLAGGLGKSSPAIALSPTKAEPER